MPSLVVASNSGATSASVLIANHQVSITAHSQLTADSKMTHFSQSQSYFMTGSLLPISSFWCQAPLGSRTAFGGGELNPCGHSPYSTSSLTRGWVCLLWTGLAYVKCTYLTYSMSLRILPFELHTGPMSVQALQKQIMSVLLILCYNRSIVTWRVISLTAPKFRPLIFSMSGFALSYTVNMVILMILYDFCLFFACTGVI
jgi:hypothetical protein